MSRPDLDLQMTDEDRQEFLSEALERLLPELRAFARSLSSDKTLADDLVQDACLIAWDKRDQFKPGAAARPWLFTILRNQFYQIKRRDWRNVGLEPEQAEQALTAPVCLESNSDVRVLNEITQKLPIAQREALILVLAAGYTYQEAGEICGCSAGTIKSRVSRARQTVLQDMAAVQKTSGDIVSSGPSNLTSGFEHILNTIDDIERRVKVAA